jgi:hypothetical protein
MTLCFSICDGRAEIEESAGGMAEKMSRRPLPGDGAQMKGC